MDSYSFLDSMMDPGVMVVDVAREYSLRVWKLCCCPGAASEWWRITFLHTRREFPTVDKKSTTSVTKRVLYPLNICVYRMILISFGNMQDLPSTKTYLIHQEISQCALSLFPDVHLCLPLRHRIAIWKAQLSRRRGRLEIQCPIHL